MNKYLLFILFGALFLRLVNIDQSFWLDEAAQVIESARPLRQQLQIVSDFHPPGFHMLLHFWMLISHSEVWIRLLSVIFSLGSISGVYAIGKRLADEKTGLLAALFLSVNPYHIWYSQEARPYMMFVFFAALSVYALVSHRWKLYTASLIGAWYSTYFAPFVFLGHLICVVWLQRKSLRPFIVSHLLAGAVLLPWLPFFFQQLTVGTSGFFSGWTDVVSIAPVKAVLLTFAKFILGRGSIDNNFLYALVIFPVFLFFLFSCRQSLKTHTGKILFLTFWVPFLASVLITFLVPVLAPQRLTFMLPIFSLLLALGFFTLREKYQSVAIAGIVITSAVGIMQYYTDPSVQREQWREAVHSVESEAPPYSIALFAFPDPFAPYLWYQNGSLPGIGVAPTFVVRQEDLQKQLLSRLTQTDRIYLFHYLTGLTDSTGIIDRYIVSRGFIDIDKKNFEGVGFITVYEHL